MLVLHPASKTKIHSKTSIKIKIVLLLVHMWEKEHRWVILHSTDFYPIKCSLESQHSATNTVPPADKEQCKSRFMDVMGFEVGVNFELDKIEVTLVNIVVSQSGQ